MYVDGLQLLGGTEVERKLISPDKRGNAFPESPVTGDYFELLNPVGEYLPGIYQYSEQLLDWVSLRAISEKPYDVSVFIPDSVDANAIIFKTALARNFRLPADFDNSYGFADLPPASNMDMVIKRQGVTGPSEEIGRIKFVEDSQEATFVSSTPGQEILMYRGDRLMVSTEDTIDLVMASVQITIAGYTLV